ncbi:hypothetical protein ABMA28_002844 [Loxostege sticticalis]|uniref:Uncharacterized protein n=1 Tax=Loxostege sticticalis TaxID=481309 RepID=A0ABD0T2G2_LOXSC
MFKIIFNFFLLVGLVDFGYSSVVPFVTKCKAADSKCLKKSSQAIIPMFANGIPEFGVEKLDPVHFKDPIDASTSGLKLILKDTTFTGLKDCVVKKIQRDVDKNKLIGKLMCTVSVEGDYEMDGQLLIVRVQGQGKIHVLLRKIVISLEADMSEKVGKDGQKHWDIKRFTHSFELLDKADVEFENLFTGNDVIGRAASQVIATSGNDIVIEVGPPVVKAMATRVIANIKKFFNNVPPGDLSLD